MATPDLSEFHELAKPKHRTPPCKVVEAIDTLAEDAAETVTAALAADRREIPDGVVAEWFMRRDIELSVTAVTNHRRRRCACRHG